MSSNHVSRPWYAAFVIFAIAVAGLASAAFYKDQFRAWKDWQRSFVEQEIVRATTPEQAAAAKRIRVEIRQTQLPELRRVDRCITCHLAVDDPSYAGYPQPFAYHPNHDRHAFDKFGCTICHGGQGRATTQEAAHGAVEHWDQPLLPLRYVEASCGKCHVPEDVPEAAALTQGRKLFDDLGCRGCHRLNGIGNSIGPELDHVGRRRSPDWLVAHFRNPAEVTPGSAMPVLGLSDTEIDELTVFMLSLTGEPLTEYYVSMRTLPGANLGQRLFEEKGCIGCHAVAGRGGDVGPDLEGLGQRRDAEWIYSHFRDPQAVSPGTVMPQFSFSEQEARALTEFVLRLSDSEVVGYLKIPRMMSSEQRGAAVYTKYGCAGCHGRDGKGGVINPNAKTGEQVPSLLYVAEGYTTKELTEFIKRGQSEIAPLDAKRPAPPLYMPPWAGKIAPGELEDLVAYLQSLFPEEEGLDW